MLDEFMHSVFARWPNVVVQFEDFATPKAVALLERYRYKCAAVASAARHNVAAFRHAPLFRMKFFP